MADVQLTTEDQPEPRDVAFLEDQINAFNVAATRNDDYRPLAIFIHDPQGGVVAGLAGFTWGGCLKVATLWVREDRRRGGLGARLLAAAEGEARARGCLHAVLETHSFQAPAFYQSQGYAICGVARDYPVGHQQYYLEKVLA